jgi:hypothetical protein
MRRLAAPAQSVWVDDTTRHDAANESSSLPEVVVRSVNDRSEFIT